MPRMSEYFAVWWAVHLLVLGSGILGCTTTPRIPPIKEAMLREGIPADSGLAFGRVRLEGLRKTIVETHRIDVALRNQTTNQRLTHTLDASGEFFLALPAGRYRITEVSSGFDHLWEGREGAGLAYFFIPPEEAVYLGTLLFQAPTAQRKGEVAILDEFEAATKRLRARHPTFPFAKPPLKGLMFMIPPDRTAGMFVDAILNGKVIAPFLLDTGATYTTLTRQSAKDLGITATEDLPKKRFLTMGGVVLAPVTKLGSLRVGTAEVRDVEVAIDVDARLRVGLLGMTFLRHFKVTVDQERGQVTFDR